jgi:CRP-like cAMP-binding protein
LKPDFTFVYPHKKIEVMEITLKNFVNQYMDMPAESLRAAEEKMTVVHLKKGDHFQFAGEPASHLALIVRGILRTYSIVSQEERTIRFDSEGDFAVDLGSLMKGNVSDRYIQALEDVELLVISKVDLCQLYKKYHCWSELGRIYFQELFIQEQNKLASALHEDALTRYNNLQRNLPKLHNRAPQNYIASYLGITPQSLSRLRKIRRKP